jgi:phosphatidate phosphatase APP1
MGEVRDILARLVRDAEGEFDRLKYRLAHRFWGPDPVRVVSYRGFGARDRVCVRGRVLEEQGITPAADEDSLWRNLLNTFKRMESDEVPHARLAVAIRGETHHVVADAEGHFDETVTLARPLPAGGDPPVATITLLEPYADDQADPVRAATAITVPSPRASLGVISDIDDTVIRTDATSLVRMARTVFLRNARTRLPFAGAAAFYRALAAGGSRGGPNPLFYVSNGPWNLFDLLDEFLDLQGFPPRPLMFLRNWGIDASGILPTDARRHKLGAIDRILDTYADLPFLLIGDSGEHDPEIYAEVVRRHGPRIAGVFIRDVGGGRRDLDALAADVAAHGSVLLVARDSASMAAEAAARDWIDPAHLAAIDRERAEDEADPGLLEELVNRDAPPPV